MPYNMAVEVTTAGGAKVTYRIAHAWHAKLTGPNLWDTNLYDRNYWGYYMEDEIIVHGHTPTIVEGYLDSGSPIYDRPGMICYRHNDIDVDGGCCFYGYRSDYPCMLCGVCLETLEEFYSYELEERIGEEAAKVYAAKKMDPDRMEMLRRVSSDSLPR